MSAKNYWLAFGIGVSAGAAIALLYAPQSGERTRKKLRKGMGEAGDYLQDAGDYLKTQAERFSDEAQDAIKRARKEAVHLVDKAGDHATDVVGSVSGAVNSAVKICKSSRLIREISISELLRGTNRHYEVARWRVSDVLDVVFVPGYAKSHVSSQQSMNLAVNGEFYNSFANKPYLAVQVALNRFMRSSHLLRCRMNL